MISRRRSSIFATRPASRRSSLRFWLEGIHRAPSMSAARVSRHRPLACTPKAIGSTAALPKRRSEEHTSELQSLMRISYAVFCLKKKKEDIIHEEYKEQTNY